VNAFRVGAKEGESRLYSSAEAILFNGVGLQLVALYNTLFGDPISRFQFEKQQNRVVFGDSDGGLLSVSEKIRPLPEMPIRFGDDSDPFSELP